jgi:hypothetical protein
MMSDSLLVLRRSVFRGSVFRRAIVVVVLCAAMVGLAGVPAQARVFIGVGIPFPGYYPGYWPGPYYYPPPAYYPPPPVVYAPPPQAYSQMPSPTPSSGGQSCYAGPYVCPMDRPVATGASCYCLGNGSQKVWGKAN